MKLLIFFPIILIASCTSFGPKFSSIEPKSKTKSLIYVYRPSAFTGSARRPDIILNDKKVGSISNGGYFYFEADPIQSKVSIRDFAGEETGTFSFNLRKNEIYFLRLDLSSPNLKNPVDSKGKSTKDACPYMGRNFTHMSADQEVIKAMDTRIQTLSCWPGFMFVSEELAMKEIRETNLSR